MLSSVLEAQMAKGREYCVGDRLTALDFYWAAFCNIAVLPSHDWIPLAPEWRAMFIAPDPAVDVAITPALRAHRDHMMETYFRIPMEI
jgi:glutathione S-transferase